MTRFPLRAFTILRRRTGQTRSDIENRRDRQIRELVTHAYNNVPFYRRLYDSHGVLPTSVRGFGDLSMLPTVSKRELQEAPPNDLLAGGVDERRLRAQRTTGTSGEPLIVRRTRGESFILKLQRFQIFRSFGIGPTDHSVGVRLPIHPRPGLSRRIGNSLGLYPWTIVFVHDPIQVLTELKRLSPDILGSVPGFLSAIAARWPAEAIEEIRTASWPRLLLTGGELLTPSVRSHLQRVFGAPLLDVYSSVEFNVMASQCVRSGSYHVSDETVALEVLAERRSALPGEVGNIVGTALHSFAAPLIRYSMEDAARNGTSTCACGSPHSTIEQVRGRVGHYLELPDGFIIPHVELEWVVSGASWVRQMQTIPSRTDNISVRIAPTREPSAQEIEDLHASIELFLRNQVTVDIVIDPDLGPEGGEKFRSVVSHT